MTCSWQTNQGKSRFGAKLLVRTAAIALLFATIMIACLYHFRDRSISDFCATLENAANKPLRKVTVSTLSDDVTLSPEKGKLLLKRIGDVLADTWLSSRPLEPRNSLYQYQVTVVFADDDVTPLEIYIKAYEGRLWIDKVELYRTVLNETFTKRLQKAIKDSLK